MNEPGDRQCRRVVFKARDIGVIYCDVLSRFDIFDALPPHFSDKKQLAYRCLENDIIRQDAFRLVRSLGPDVLLLARHSIVLKPVGISDSEETREPLNFLQVVLSFIKENSSSFLLSRPNFLSFSLSLQLL